MLNVSIGAHIQTGLDGSRARTTIEKAVFLIYTSSTHAFTKSGFILEDSTNSTTRRNRSPIYFFSRLVRQRHYFGNLLSKVQLLKSLKTQKSPEVQRLADMISTVSSTKTSFGTASKELLLFADSTEMILHLILRYLGTDPCRRWLRPVRDWNPNDCHRLTELLTSML